MTAPREHRAVATISSCENTTKYILHPVKIDQCLQIMMVAAYERQDRLLPELSVVTAIEHLAVFDGGQAKLKVGRIAAKSRSGGLTGDLSVVSEDGGLILLMKRCETSLVPNDRPKCEDKLFSFVKWDTDATYCNLNQAFSPSHSQSDLSILLDVLKLLAHSNPELRILELGDSADETTRFVLSPLKTQYGERLYLTYTYTATSFDAAFRVKDAENQPPSQIFQAGAYNLIITTDVWLFNVSLCI